MTRSSANFAELLCSRVAPLQRVCGLYADTAPHSEDRTSRFGRCPSYGLAVFRVNDTKPAGWVAEPVNSCRQVRSLVIAVNIRLEAAKGPTVARLPSDEVERECRL